jgi:repressor of nif and glnA expression
MKDTYEKIKPVILDILKNNGELITSEIERKLLRRGIKVNPLYHLRKLEKEGLIKSIYFGQSVWKLKLEGGEKCLEKKS